MTRIIPLLGEGALSLKREADVDYGLQLQYLGSTKEALTLAQALRERESTPGGASIAWCRCWRR